MLVEADLVDRIDDEIYNEVIYPPVNEFPGKFDWFFEAWFAVNVVSSRVAGNHDLERRVTGESRIHQGFEISQKIGRDDERLYFNIDAGTVVSPNKIERLSRQWDPSRSGIGSKKLIKAQHFGLTVRACLRFIVSQKDVVELYRVKSRHK
jgi:hypothetical protein